ncbi:hypothetical protein [Nocardia alni]|uniref:hypothetical protein n=1 Tax=Nocardia alni TaxID=2815723 RepID=UPI001C21753E|nr:hypothetical protein [Nocardia alni]
MSAPGFAPDALDEFGCPTWISELAIDDPNHLLHVVRDLGPADALELLGAERRSITSCELPAERPDRWTSLPRAAIAPLNPTAVLLAGRIGEWTFVYDDLGLTLGLPQPEGQSLEAAQLLSDKGKVAATGFVTMDGPAGFIYAVDGDLLTSQELSALEELADDTPAEVRGAFETAGAYDIELDDYINMRAACILAGLPSTMRGLRHIPLLVAPLY